MNRAFILCVAGVTGVTISCVRQVQSSRVYPSVPAAPVEVPAIQRQVINSVDAGDGDYLVRSLRQKMAAEPDNLKVRLDLIEHYSLAGYSELALEHCRLASVRFADSAEVQLALAKALRAAHMTSEAAQSLQKFLEAHPQQSAEYDSWLGIMRDELGQWKQGEAAHRAALALTQNLDYLHNNLGYNLLKQNRNSEAAFEFRQALKLRPNSEVARNNLGMALAVKPEEAIVHWQSVTDPATAHSNMAALLIEQGQYDQARKELDLALGYNRSHAAALNNLRLISQRDGKPASIPIKPVKTRWVRFRSAVWKVVGG